MELIGIESDSVLDEAVYAKEDDYDALLANLDIKSKAVQQSYTKIKQEISLIDEKMKHAANKASKGLEQAQKDHQMANQAMKSMETALMSSQQTLIVASKLKQLEQIKKTNHKVMKYSQAFVRLSDNEMSAQYYINTICQPRDLEESLDIAETLKVLNSISLEPKAKTKGSLQDESVTAYLKQSKRMVKLALDVSDGFYDQVELR
jgi:hypothetical protein